MESERRSSRSRHLTPIIALVVLASLAASCRGSTHVDALIFVVNQKHSPIDVSWSGMELRTGQKHGSVHVGRCAIHNLSLLAGDYTLVVGDPPLDTFNLHIPAGSSETTRTILIKADGSVDRNAPDPTAPASRC